MKTTKKTHRIANKAYPDTVWTCRIDDKNIKTFANETEACLFMSSYISKRFGKYYSPSRFKDGGWAFNSCIIKVKLA